MLIEGSNSHGGNHLKRELRERGRALARGGNLLGRSYDVVGRRYARGYVCSVGTQMDAG